MYIVSKWIMFVLGAVLLVLENGGALAEQSCDTNKLKTTPPSRFTVNKQEGTASDAKTKLTWKICAEGQSYQSNRCAGDATKFSWEVAMKTYGANGKGWRLPNIDELNSIVEERCSSPSINLIVFPDIAEWGFWSGSSSVQNPDSAWSVFFYIGNTATESKATGHYVRLVRGGPWFDSLGNQVIKQEIAKQIEMQPLEQRVAAFRKSLQTGDESNCGLVIEVKRPIAKIQTASGERWLKVEQLYPHGSQSCEQVATSTPSTSPDSNRLVGTRVCRVVVGVKNQATGRGFCGPICTIGLSSCSGHIAVSGVVERMVGEKIQIRISNSHVKERPECYAPIQTEEGATEKNSIIWDQTSNWFGC